MDPAIIFFGLGIGVLVGMTGMGGGSLMTPLLILVFGIQPTTAIGTDIFYSAVTKTVGGWRHLRIGTVNMELVKWLALGSVPAAVGGVAVVLADPGPDRRRPPRLARLRGARRHPADGRDHHPDAGADPAQPRRRARPLRRRTPPQSRRSGYRRDDRLRDRRHLGRLGHGDRDPVDRRLPLGAEESRRHRRLPRRDPALGGGPCPLDRRQRRLRPRRQHPDRLGPRRRHWRGPLRQGPTGLHPHRARSSADRLRAS